jgi:hypothetical protein
MYSEGRIQYAKGIRSFISTGITRVRHKSDLQVRRIPWEFEGDSLFKKF